MEIILKMFQFASLGPWTNVTTYMFALNFFPEVSNLPWNCKPGILEVKKSLTYLFHIYAHWYYNNQGIFFKVQA